MISSKLAMRRIRPALLAALVAATGLATTAQAQAPKVDERITTATGVRVRASAATTAAEVGKLPLGTVLTVVETSPRSETIAGATAPWYRIAPAFGVEGWVFGAFTTAYDSARRDRLLMQIADSRIGLAEPTFNDMADLKAFAGSVGPTLAPGDRARMELFELRAMDKAAHAIPIDKQEEEPYAAWRKAQGDRIVYSEPSGQWMADASLFWAGAKKYHGVPVGEQWAWAGAQADIPGECEGFLPCHLEVLRISYARYLQEYPAGTHAGDALGVITESIGYSNEPDASYELPAEDKPTYRKIAGEIRAAVAKTSSPKRAAALKAIDRMVAKYK